MNDDPETEWDLVEAEPKASLGGCIFPLIIGALAFWGGVIYWFLK